LAWGFRPSWLRFRGTRSRSRSPRALLEATGPSVAEAVIGAIGADVTEIAAIAVDVIETEGDVIAIGAVIEGAVIESGRSGQKDPSESGRSGQKDPSERS